MAPGGSNEPPTPLGPGWYPDPWSATGRGERYFDGQRWGTTERPIGREVVVVLGDHMPRRSGTRGSRVRRSRRFRAALPFVALVVAVGVVWGVGRVGRDQGRDSPDETAQPPRDVGESTPDDPFEGPPPSDEAGSSPLGTPERAVNAGAAFAFIATQDDDPSIPVAFDPCRPIHYVVRPDGAPPDGNQLIRQAVARISRATGLVFIDDGPTTELPRQDRKAYQPDRYGASRWAPVVFAWSDENESATLAGDIAGVGGSQLVYTRGGDAVYVTGQVMLDREDLERDVTPDRAEAAAIVVHELGHVVGLDHVTDASQLMFAETQPGITQLGDGDLAGLAQLGTQACFPEL